MSVVKFNQNAENNYSLALKKIEEQDYLFAIRLLKDAIKIDSNSKYFVELAELYYKLGQYDESTATYIALSNKIITMEIALGALHSHQASLGTGLNPDNLLISSGCFFNLSRKKVENRHLNKILQEYQKIALNLDEPKLINLGENAILRKLNEAKSYAMKGDFSKAMILLDEIDDKKFLDKVLELKVIIYFGAGDYDNVLEIGKTYNEIKKGNPTIARSVLYAIFALDGKKITPEFRNAFNEFEIEILEFGKAESSVGLFELAEMVGYREGANKIIEKMIKKYPYDLSVVLTTIAHYGANRNYKKLDKLLIRANEIFNNSPGVAFFNCLKKKIEQEPILDEAWYSLVEENIALQYANVFVIDYLKKVMQSKDYFDEDLFKVAITFLDRDKLKEFLTIKEIEQLPEYCNMLIWGIENPYLGIDNKILLIELYISTCSNSNKIFVIPTELGISCLKLIGYKANILETTQNSVYNAVYSNLIFTESDFDKMALLESIKKVFCLFGNSDKKTICAVTHSIYYLLKKYELHLELIAGAYQITIEELEANLKQVGY